MKNRTLASRIYDSLLEGGYISEDSNKILAGADKIGIISAIENELDFNDNANAQFEDNWEFEDLFR